MTSLLILAFLLQVSASVIQLPKNQTACTGADWSDILVFLVANYVAHTATVIRFPGETAKELNWRRSDALLAPFIGLMYALRKIQWSLVFERDPLRRACRGEALCQIIRTSVWLPWDGCTIKAWVSEKEDPHQKAENPPLQSPHLGKSDSIAKCDSKKLPKRCRIALRHTEQTGAKPVLVTAEKLELVQGLGVRSIPSGYGILRCQGIPALRVTSNGSECKPYYDHRMMESIVAMFQIMSATVSLYRSRGEQFDRYGYTAFSITVLPYAVMSFANLLANMLSMDYPLFHLVSTPEMEEATGRGASVTAVVGKLTPECAFEDKMVSVRFEESNGVLHVYKITVLGKDYLGELHPQAGQAKTEALQACPLITIPSYIRVEEEKPRLSLSHFLREHLGLILAIPVGVALFSTPSITIHLLTRYKPGQSMVLERLVVLLWLFLQQFSLLFLLAWNVAFRVEHALRAPQLYSRILELVLGCMLRTIGVAGYVCVIWQFKRFGVCIQV